MVQWDVVQWLFSGSQTPACRVSFRPVCGNPWSTAYYLGSGTEQQTELPFPRRPLNCTFAPIRFAR